MFQSSSSMQASHAHVVAEMASKMQNWELAEQAKMKAWMLQEQRALDNKHTEMQGELAAKEQQMAAAARSEILQEASSKQCFLERLKQEEAKMQSARDRAEVARQWWIVAMGP